MRAFVCSLLSAAVELQLTNRSCLDGRLELPVECRSSLTEAPHLAGPSGDVPEAERECLGRRDWYEGSNRTRRLSVMVLLGRLPHVEEADSSGIDGDSQRKPVELPWATQEAMGVLPKTDSKSARGSGHYSVHVKAVKAVDLRRGPLRALQSPVMGCAWQMHLTAQS